MTDSTDPRAAFIAASLWHGSLDTAAAILAAHPEIASSDIHTAALLGDDAGVRHFLALDPASAVVKGGPNGWDALTHLCFSKYLRLDSARSDGFVRAAQALLAAGASANTGFYDEGHTPEPEFESALYGAAGVAHHAGLTRLLLEGGADPNDEEVPYHSPETYDNAALSVLLDSGKLTDDSLATMLLRKADWHDHDGIKLLLERGADPNHITRWRHTALHQALRRDNRLANIEVLLDHHADATLALDGHSAVSIAARRGRGDALELFDRRGTAGELHGLVRLLAACATDDPSAIRTIVEGDPDLVRQLALEGGERLAEFSGNGNSSGVGHLLDLGVSVAALYKQGDGYFNIARDSTALHVAAWRGRHATVKLLIDRGAHVDPQDGNGQSPLALAVRACVNSYWTHLRSPESVQALLQAGASVTGVEHPSGYAEVDELLRVHRRE